MLENKQRIGVYPGTFDPVTLGHLDIIARAATMVDKLIVAVAESPHKNPLFAIEDRVRLINESMYDDRERFDGKNIEIISFNNLLMEFVNASKAQLIIRGLRNTVDFEYEFQMANMNYCINKNVETVFLMSQPEYRHVASSFIREMARLDADISHFVPHNVEKALKSKFIS